MTSLLSASLLLTLALRGVPVAGWAAESPAQAADSLPFAEPGKALHYRLEQPGAPAGSTVTEFSLSFGTNENSRPTPQRWIELDATKASGEPFRVWFLSSVYP